MARKKIVFVIVEGPSDREALGALLQQLYGRDYVVVHVMHYDITSENRSIPDNIAARLTGIVRAYAGNYHVTRQNFKEILHLVDMDGAFIPPSHVVEDPTAGKPLYSPTEIRTASKWNIEHRNAKKAANINRLCACSSIWNVPYRIFYMSCNLDHVLYNKLNSSDEEKEQDSFHFAKKYRQREGEFLAYLTQSEFSVMDGYEESWTFIRQGLHSLERHTNLGLCFAER